MPINKQYYTWNMFIRQLRPTERNTRIRNFTWLIVGIYQCRSVHLSKIAEKIPGTATLPSITRRLSRFLNNPAIRVREWYEPIARNIIQRLSDKVIRLIVDGSKVGFGNQLLIVAIAYRKRTIPLAWTWVKSNRGHSTSYKQKALLSYVHGLIPPKTSVILLGDAEFGAVEVQKLLNKWRWEYVLRQKGCYLFKQQDKDNFQRLDSMVDKPRQSVWLTACKLTAKYAYSVNLLAHWEAGEKDPWLLATNLPSQKEALKAYKCRMWIEEMFGDLKGNGFDLESTHLRDFLRLSRLTLAVVMLYVWLVTFGARVIKAGKRRLVDRSDRRDHSIFRIGRNMVERCLTNGVNLRISLIPCR